MVTWELILSQKLMTHLTAYKILIFILEAPEKRHTQSQPCFYLLLDCVQHTPSHTNIYLLTVHLHQWQFLSLRLLSPLLRDGKGIDVHAMCEFCPQKCKKPNSLRMRVSLSKIVWLRLPRASENIYGNKKNRIIIMSAALSFLAILLCSLCRPAMTDLLLLSLSLLPDVRT